MRFVEVALLEPEKNVVALADAYLFSPFQPSLLPRNGNALIIPIKLPPRRARLVVYNRQTNETIALLEPEKNVVALPDAYLFSPFQPSLLPRNGNALIIPTKLPPRRARLVVYNRQTNET
uniref:Uncharacterized protein n=1 Tax=Oryza rufipogon TaxID=4529 RepID=A0A0E0P4Y1_ORYRU